MSYPTDDNNNINIQPSPYSTRLFIENKTFTNQTLSGDTDGQETAPHSLYVVLDPGTLSSYIPVLTEAPDANDNFAILYYMSVSGTLTLKVRTPDGTISDVGGSGSGVVSETDPVVGSVSGIVKADGNGNIEAAEAGVDYALPGDFDGALPINGVFMLGDDETPGSWRMIIDSGDLVFQVATLNGEAVEWVTQGAFTAAEGD